jgi:hypothetical protein
MAVAARAPVSASGPPPWVGPLRWVLRSAGVLGCVAALVFTPDLVAEVLHGGVTLEPAGLESLLAYRVLAALVGGLLLLTAERLPGLAHRPEALLRSAGIGLPVGVVSACVVLKLALEPQHSAYKGLVSEDSLVEYATCAAYLLAAVFAAGVARGLARRDARLLAGLWAGLALALALVAGEEISWGQRLLGVATPEVFADNLQGEMNVHNLAPVQRLLHPAYILVGVFGAFGWCTLRERGPARWRELARWLVPPPALLGCFLPVAVFYVFLDYTPARWIGEDGLRFGFVSTYDQEPAELLLALGFLLFALHALGRLRRG